MKRDAVSFRPPKISSALKIGFFACCSVLSGCVATQDFARQEDAKINSALVSTKNDLEAKIAAAQRELKYQITQDFSRVQGQVTAEAGELDNYQAETRDKFREAKEAAAENIAELLSNIDRVENDLDKRIKVNSSTIQSNKTAIEDKEVLINRLQKDLSALQDALASEAKALKEEIEDREDRVQEMTDAMKLELLDDVNKAEVMSKKTLESSREIFTKMDESLGEQETLLKTQLETLSTVREFYQRILREMETTVDDSQ